MSITDVSLRALKFKTYALMLVPHIIHHGLTSLTVLEKEK